MGNVGFPELIFLVGIICMVACYKIMKSKNREPWLGVVLGLVFGLLGVLIVVVLPRREPDAAPGTPQPPAGPQPS